MNFKLDRSFHRAGAGEFVTLTGVRLPIWRSAASVVASSKINQSTRVRNVMPLTRATSQALAEPSAPQRIHVNVLLVEDDDDDIFVFDRLLKRSKKVDFSMNICHTTAEAEVLLASGSFGIVFVDYWLGKEISLDFVRRVSGAAMPPFVLVSGLDTPEIQMEARKAGAVGFICKSDLILDSIENMTLSLIGASPHN
jgi:CheY-like chemotaxis protein